MKDKLSISVDFCAPTFRGGHDLEHLRTKSFFGRFLHQYFRPQFGNNPDFIFYADAGSGEHLDYPSKTKRIFVTGENIPPNWSEADYAFTHEPIWNDRHWRLPHHRHWWYEGRTNPIRDFDLVRNRSVKFCNFLYSNERAHERIDFLDRLQRYRSVDSGGRVRNNIGYRVGNKPEFLSNYKFTIAFENESHPGYATEKIIEPLLMGSIPIYWGDPRIEDDFNPDCLVNVHRFSDFDAVIEEVMRIDADDSLWERYVSAPIFRDGVMPDCLTDEAYCDFLHSIFTKPAPPISRWRKRKQRIGARLRRGRAAQGLAQATSFTHRARKALARRFF